MRRTSSTRRIRGTLRTQRGVLCDVMLSAAECGAWLTLGELGKLTKYPPASISAQLRHLRKPQYGGFVVEKRRREGEELGRSEERGPVWEYRLLRKLGRAVPLLWLHAPVGGSRAEVEAASHS